MPDPTQPVPPMADPEPVVTPEPVATSEPQPVVPEPVAPEPGVEPQLSVRDQLTASGFDASGYATDEAAIAAMAVNANAYRDAQPLIGYGREYVENAEEFQTWQAAQQQAAPVPEPETPSWTQPEMDPNWDTLTVFDEAAGQYVAVQRDSPSMVRAAEQRNDYQRATRDNLNTLLQNPVGTVWDGGVSERVDKLVAERVDAAIAQYASQQQTQAFLNENRAELFQVDPGGEVQVDPITGQQLLTPRGEAMSQY